jgi:hypothetical protein
MFGHLLHCVHDGLGSAHAGPDESLGLLQGLARTTFHPPEYGVPQVEIITQSSQDEKNPGENNIPDFFPGECVSIVCSSHDVR